MKLRISTVLLIVAAAAFGCTTVEYYQPPASANSPQTAATVVGSRLNLLSLVRGVEVSIIRVDDKPAPVFSYDKPFLIAPGVHRVVISAQQGTESASALVDFNFEARRSYIVRSSDIRGGASEVWLEDQGTGQVVGRKFRADMAGNAPRSPAPSG